MRCWRWRWGRRARPGCRAHVGLASDLDAEQVVRAEAIWTTLRENGVDQEGRVDELTALFETRADVGLIGRLALGRHWNRLPRRNGRNTRSCSARS